MEQPCQFCAFFAFGWDMCKKICYWRPSTGWRPNCRNFWRTPGCKWCALVSPFFYIVNLANLNCFLSFLKNCRSKKIYFAFWRPTICKKWLFSTLKFFNFFLYCKFRQFKLFFIICKKLQVQKNLFSVLTTDNMRKMTFLSIFSTLKFLKFFYNVN